MFFTVGIYVSLMLSSLPLQENAGEGAEGVICESHDFATTSRDP